MIEKECHRWRRAEEKEIRSRLELFSRGLQVGRWNRLGGGGGNDESWFRYRERWEDRKQGCVWGGDDAKERWDDVVWELIIKLERTKEREMSSYRRDEAWKEEWSRELTEEDTGGMEGHSRRKGSEWKDKKTVNEVYEYTTCYWLKAFLVNCIFPMIALWLALLNENYGRIFLFFWRRAGAHCHWEGKTKTILFSYQGKRKRKGI